MAKEMAVFKLRKKLTSEFSFWGRSVLLVWLPVQHPRLALCQEGARF